MLDMLLGASTSDGQETAVADPNRSDILTKGKRQSRFSSVSVPVFIHFSGGNWEGQIEQRATGMLELKLQGMPPVQVAQNITFQCFGKGTALMTSIQKGTIQHVDVHRGPTVWEGRTSIQVELDDVNLEPFVLEPGCFMMGQISEQDTHAVLEKGTGLAESLSAQAAQTRSSCHQPNQAGSTTRHIQSDRIALKNSTGRTIMAYHDYPLATDLSNLPIVVIAPGYGETKRDYLTLAYYFASNGFHVIRYDHTNHVGESDGNHFNFTLSRMKKDFLAVTRLVRQQWPQSTIIGIASSLAAPVVLKAEVEEPSLALLVQLVGVVDVERTVATVHQEDLFAHYRKGHIPYSTNILGFNVNGHFLTDAATNNFSTLDRTVEHAQALQTPVMYISAGRDAWIDRHDAEIYKQALGAHLSEWLDVPEALHRIQENPKVARRVYRHIINHCRTHLAPGMTQSEIHEPNRLTLGRQNRQEKMALQAHSQTDVGQDFWDDYLDHFQSVGKCQDYVQLLDHVFHALGPVTGGQQVLDAGCGNGNAGLFLLESLKSQTDDASPTANRPIRYVGIDACSEALERAQTSMTHTYHALQQRPSSKVSPLHMTWAQVDLQQKLPFQDHQFDRIVSNLVLGYVADPLASLRELYRVLAPGGRMVLSNLKPNGDFSGIYQNLMTQAGEHNQKTEARELLNNYGKIRQAEKEGQFRFFDHTEWRKALDSLDCVHAGVYPTFGNQAYLVVLEKPLASQAACESSISLLNSQTREYKDVA